VATFESVTPEQFAAVLSESPASQTFRRVLAGLDRAMLFGGGRGVNYIVHRGALKVARRFSPPAFHTLLIGDLIVDGLVDAHYPDADEGGSLIVIGNVACDVFANDYSKGTIIDGDLTASELILNAYEDSGLWVAGDLKTHFFFGEDIWAEVGGKAEMTYGDGYCLPIGYSDASLQAVWPKHDLETSLRHLNIPDAAALDAGRFKKLLASGDQLFR
jgi:hypothetical protein